jgi:hypothetical protein
MPDINEYLKKKSPKDSPTSKKSDWDISSIISSPKITPTRPQRRPGRGEDSPLLSSIEPIQALGEYITPPQVGTTPSEVRTKSEQDPNKVGTNTEQSQNKLGTKLEQIESKVGTTPSKEALPLIESQNKVRSQPRTEARTKLEQSWNKVGTKLSFSSVVGLQRRIIFFIFEATKASREKLTAPIAIQNLADACQTTSMAAQVTVRRLEKKELLIRAEYKDGRGGWTRYELPSELFQELLQLESQNKVGSNLEQSQNKVGSQLRTELRTSAPSSSSFLDLENLKTTTTELEVNLSDTPALSPEWVSLDIEPLTTIGFTQNHLSQIARQNLLKPEVVQDSIHGFAFDLRVNGKGSALKSGPLNFFMGILKKGIPYAPPENYVTPEEEALKKYLSAKKAQAEKRELLERELQDSEFQEWVRGLDASEKREIAPQAQEGGLLYLGQLRVHFDQVVWPTARLRILLGAGSEAAPN